MPYKSLKHCQASVALVATLALPLAAQEREVELIPPPHHAQHDHADSIEHVLSNLPDDFDVTLPELDVNGPHDHVVYVTDQPPIIRFRGSRVTGLAQHSVHWDNGNEEGESTHRLEFQGSFSNGRLDAEGTHAFFSRRAGASPFAKSWCKLALHGQTNVEGVLSIEVEVIPLRYVYQVRDEWREDQEWVKNWPEEARRWREPLKVQLPVPDPSDEPTTTTDLTPSSGAP